MTDRNDHEDQITGQLVPEYTRALLANPNVTPYDDPEFLVHRASLFARQAITVGHAIANGDDEEDEYGANVPAAN